MDPTPLGPSARSSTITSLALALSLVLGATACAKDDDGGGSPPAATLTTTEPDTTTTTSLEDVEADVEAAYKSSFTAYYDAVAEPTEPNKLDTTHTDESLSRATRYVDQLVQADQVVEFPNGRPTLTILEVKVQPDEATIEACEIDDAVVLQLPSRTVIDDEVISQHVTAQMVRVSGDWLLADLTVDKEWRDGDGCDR